jgi:hypothetical protein
VFAKKLLLSLLLFQFGEAKVDANTFSNPSEVVVEVVVVPVLEGTAAALAEAGADDITDNALCFSWGKMDDKDDGVVLAVSAGVVGGCDVVAVGVVVVAVVVDGVDDVVGGVVPVACIEAALFSAETVRGEVGVDELVGKTTSTGRFEEASEDVSIVNPSK